MQLKILESTTSTNDYLLDALKGAQPVPNAVMADRQTHGRGRNGNVWQSNRQAGLYLSYAHCFETVPAQLSALSLVAGLSAISLLQSWYGLPNLQIKWPNDLYLGNKKCAGILCETWTPSDRQGIVVVIGFGLNLRLDNHAKSEFNATDLHDQGVMCNDIIKINLAKALCDQWQQDCNIFANQGLLPFIEPWKQHDFLAGKSIQILRGCDALLLGHYAGIDNNGALLLQTHEKQHVIMAGEVSVRPIVWGC